MSQQIWDRRIDDLIRKSEMTIKFLDDVDKTFLPLLA